MCILLRDTHPGSFVHVSLLVNHGIGWVGRRGRGRGRCHFHGLHGGLLLDYPDSRSGNNMRLSLDHWLIVRLRRGLQRGFEVRE